MYVPFQDFFVSHTCLLILYLLDEHTEITLYICASSKVPHSAASSSYFPFFHSPPPSPPSSSSWSPLPLQSHRFWSTGVSRFLLNNKCLDSPNNLLIFFVMFMVGSASFLDNGRIEVTSLACST